MLSNDTKKIIDDARNTLVGQIPVPMMQCQQITLALTYKFMSDDDQQAVELGGHRHYFTGDLEGYEWGRIMSLRLDDTQRSEVYRAGLTALRESESMPAVFREIFKDAVVPYGDHRTLALFLSTMDRMEYDDSEKLGDAYEYLLKIAEAQADAGQFRTPRHIIDFIVNIINPQKHEIVIDPACGTAGFLISTYQHVKNQHRLPSGGTTLSTLDLTRLADNLKGYDISPEMTKLAMANTYLHTQNKSPNIANYDTLTSTDHWNEYADVMLANPPFMTPKGGIKPHARFRVTAKKAEVLFVDYIASHLNEHGRAGIIVPEGIIFQKQKAYQQLRRLLLDESLVAVISLPSGVFNPYSNVKTSILILDKVLAPKIDFVAFFKVESDGYDLGSQRRPIGKDDLPAVTDEVNEYLHRLRGGETVGEYPSTRGKLVAKSKIAADGEYNLTGERYSIAAVTESQWTLVKVGEVFERSTKAVMPSNLEGPLTYVGLENISQDTGHLVGDTIAEDPATIKSLKNEFEPGDILYGKLRPNLNKVWLSDRSGVCSTDIYVIRPKQDNIAPKLYAYIFRNCRFNDAVVSQVKGAQLPRVGWDAIEGLEIPLPPLEVQRELVAEIEGYQRVIDGARAVVENWRPRVDVDPKWPMSQLSEVCTVDPPKSEVAHMDGTSEVSFVPMADMGENAMYFEVQHTKRLQDVGDSYTYFKDDDVLIAKVTPCLENGKAGIAKQLHSGIGFGSSEFYVIRSRESTTPEWIFLCLATPEFRAWATPKMTGTGGLQRVPRWAIDEYEIPLPPLETQRTIAGELQEERTAVDQAEKLAAKMEQRIQGTIARVWEG